MNNLSGKKYGRLTVLSLMPERDVRGNKQWNCLCRCGRITVKTTSQLGDKNNLNASCGCALQDSIKKASAAAVESTTKFRHPLKQKIKNLYRNMVNRCNNPYDLRYHDYGGRGIRVCDEWLTDRYKFYNWCLDNGIDDYRQIDRIDNNGDYSPSNCKFSTRIEQANNTRKNVFLSWNGSTMTVSQWARVIGVRQQALQHRISRGWSVDRIFTQPFRSKS